MTKLLLALAGVVALAIAVTLAVAAHRPDRLSIRRTIAIHAPPEEVFALINDFHNWRRWAPQDLEDKSLQRSYGGPAAGRGALSAWHGAGESGAGRMQITNSAAPERVEVTVDFTRPFVAHNINEFTLIARGDSTQVTWDLTAQNRYSMKVMGLFVDMGTKIGEHLEKGLAALKSAAEK
jgi:uncharacterized protein YndB with AHSA1/START domain